MELRGLKVEIEVVYLYIRNDSVLINTHSPYVKGIPFIPS